MEWLIAGFLACLLAVAAGISVGKSCKLAPCVHEGQLEQVAGGQAVRCCKLHGHCTRVALGMAMPGCDECPDYCPRKRS